MSSLLQQIAGRLFGPWRITDPVCPACGQPLRRSPFRRRRCPGCGTRLVVRPHGDADAYSLVTVDEAVRADTRLLERLGADAAADGRPASALVEATELANRLRAAGDWPGYREARLRVATELRALGRRQSALIAALEVCYLDANGPAGERRFEPDPVGPPVAVAALVAELRAGLKLEPAELRDLFLAVARVSRGATRAPLSPDDAWRRVAARLPIAG